jgi:hypothetical protein
MHLTFDRDVVGSIISLISVLLDNVEEQCWEHCSLLKVLSPVFPKGKRERRATKKGLGTRTTGERRTEAKRMGTRTTRDRRAKTKRMGTRTTGEGERIGEIY